MSQQRESRPLPAFDRPLRRLAWVVPASVFLWILVLAGFSALLGNIREQRPVRPIELTLADLSYGTPGGSSQGGPGGAGGEGGIKAAQPATIPASRSPAPPSSSGVIGAPERRAAALVPAQKKEPARRSALRRPTRTMVKSKVEVASVHTRGRVSAIAAEDLEDEDAMEPAPSRPTPASIRPVAPAALAKAASQSPSTVASREGIDSLRIGGGGTGNGDGRAVGNGGGGEGGGTGSGVGEGSQPHAMVEHPPVPIARILPEYPSAARVRGLEGEVILRAVVDRQGAVERQIVVVQSVPLLDRAAIEALRQWRFEPGRDANNQPVPVIIQVPLRFRLR